MNLKSSMHFLKGPECFVAKIFPVIKKSKGLRAQEEREEIRNFWFKNVPFW